MCCVSSTASVSDKQQLGSGRAVFEAETNDEVFAAGCHFSQLFGDQLLFTRSCLGQFGLKLRHLLPAMTPPLDFLHPVADATHGRLLNKVFG